MSHLLGIHIVRSLIWKVKDADIMIFCNACLSGIGFWYLNLNSAFFSVAPLDWLSSEMLRTKWILPFEFLCVISALWHASWHAAPDSKVILFTDSQNMVEQSSCNSTLQHTPSLCSQHHNRLQPSCPCPPCPW